MLEPEERCAGKLFRSIAEAELAALYEADPPDFPVPPVIANSRHSCPAKDNVSTSMEIKEIWRHSPRIVVERAEDGTLTAYVFDSWPVNVDVDTWTVPEGRFGFVYRKGRCRHCGKRALSRFGRVVDAYERPELGGRLI